MTGEYIMNTDRLRRFLGPEYEHVMRYTITDAFADSFQPRCGHQLTRKAALRIIRRRCGNKLGRGWFYL